MRKRDGGVDGSSVGVSTYASAKDKPFPRFLKCFNAPTNDHAPVERQKMEDWRMQKGRNLDFSGWRLDWRTKFGVFGDNRQLRKPT